MALSAGVPGWGGGGSRWAPQASDSQSSYPRILAIKAMTLVPILTDGQAEAQGGYQVTSLLEELRAGRGSCSWTLANILPTAPSPG